MAANQGYASSKDMSGVPTAGIVFFQEILYALKKTMGKV
jgi:hypothetical protein